MEVHCTVSSESMTNAAALILRLSWDQSGKKYSNAYFQVSNEI